ncbi:hypothetical protein [Vagococcus sp. WN89Y]|uniref:hypothetical protein n=1 Tax=Vagococcus sp. WN89Y TaxID=3457258 RepID=UPI003FCD1C4E
MKWRNMLSGIIVYFLFLCVITPSHAASGGANLSNPDTQSGSALFTGTVILASYRLAMNDPAQLVTFKREARRLKNKVQLTLADSNMQTVSSPLYAARQIHLIFDGVRGTRTNKFQGDELQIKDQQGNVLQPGSEITPVRLNNDANVLNYEFNLVPQRVRGKNYNYSSVVRFNVYYE